MVRVSTSALAGQSALLHPTNEASSNPGESAVALAPEDRTHRGGGARTRASSAAHGGGPPLAGTIEMDRGRAITLGTLMSGLLDPMSAMLGMQGALRDSSAKLREQNINHNRVQADQDNRLKLEALDNAKVALEKASKKWPKWAKKLVAAVLTIAGAVASAVTGGTSVALVAVALVLLLAAKGVEKMAEKGYITGKVAMGLTIALKVVAAVLMTVAGGVGGAGAISQVAKTIADVTKVVTDVISQVKDLAVGIKELRRGKALFQAQSFQADADTHDLREEDATHQMDVSVDELQRLHQRFRRVLSKVRETAEERESATLRSLAQLGQV